MPDPLRTISDSDPPSRLPDRAARIEQLLLAGLDHYVAGRYEQAIDTWTRVTFLDRQHAKARAYVERARSALAEQQRESDELLHRGVDAFDRGETQIALELLTKAIDRVGPDEMASALLDRLHRLRGGVSETAPTAAPVVAERRSPEVTTGSSRPPWTFVVMGAAALVGVAAIVVAGLLIQEWSVEDRAPFEYGLVVQEEAPPVIGGADVAVVRARRLLAEDQPQAALTVLESVRFVDPSHGDVPALRAEAQRRLLTALPGVPTSITPPASAKVRSPSSSAKSP